MTQVWSEKQGNCWLPCYLSIMQLPSESEGSHRFFKTILVSLAWILNSGIRRESCIKVWLILTTSSALKSMNPGSIRKSLEWEEHKNRYTLISLNSLHTIYWGGKTVASLYPWHMRKARLVRMGENQLLMKVSKPDTCIWVPSLYLFVFIHSN